MVYYLLKFHHSYLLTGNDSPVNSTYELNTNNPQSQVTCWPTCTNNKSFILTCDNGMFLGCCCCSDEDNTREVYELADLVSDCICLCACKETAFSADIDSVYNVVSKAASKKCICK